MRKLRGIADIRQYFHRDPVPTYFISATCINLLGMDEWVQNFKYINYIDCFDGVHPNIITPSTKTSRLFEGIEEINNYLLERKEIVDYIKERGPGRAVFLFFDERTEELCKELDLEVCFPPAKLREEVDNKVSATRIGNEAGVPSVPNVLTEVSCYEDAFKAAENVGIGTDWVIQTAFGDSGHTTFFINSESDYKKHAEVIEAETEVKIMKRIRPHSSALEACVTRHGTIVGPLMTELIGFPELTPYRGGWCGNEVFAGAFSHEIRHKARKMTFQYGEALRKRGYRGYFEVDFLIDLDSGEVYLGEINPRITGVSSMTNLAAFAHADAPLFLFHLLEFAGVDFEIDVEALNARWSDPFYIDSWSQLVIKHTKDSVEYITDAPRSGVWQLAPNGGANFVRVQTHRRTVHTESEGFYLRIASEGDYRYEGADLGILVTPGRLMTDDFELNDRAKRWIQAIRSQYRARPLEGVESPQATQTAKVSGFKIL